MGFVDTLLGVVGFGIGITIGLVLGFFIFIYFGSSDHNKEQLVTRSIDELDPNSLIDLLPDLPLWVMGPDYERVDWFNKFFQDMWPYFNKGACGMIKTSAEATFAEYIGKYNIESIYFERLTLGDLAPKIYGLKAQDSKENELVLDLSLKWVGNSDIALAIKYLSLKLTVQVMEVQISAAIRVVLRHFVPTFPCFSSISLSVMEKPKIDFGLKIMGGDTMSIPGLYQFVQEFLSKQVAKLYMWPQSYDIDVLESSRGASMKPVGILHVKIVRAQNLLKMDFLGGSDPYVMLSITGEKLQAKKTTVKRHTLNPIWNEDFKLIVKEPKLQILQLHLYDWEKVGAHDYLGMQIFPLNLLLPYQKKEVTFSLVNSLDPSDPQNRKPRGKITVELTFIPFLEDSKKFSGLDLQGLECSHKFPENVALSGTGLLLITVVEAEDVEGKYHNNPYTTIIFRGEKRKTKTIKKTRDPLWNEEFQFVLDEAPMKEVIHVEVMSQKKRLGFKHKDSLGYVDINLADVVYNGHINEKYNLINSRNGIIHLDIRWKVI